MPLTLGRTLEENNTEKKYGIRYVHIHVLQLRQARETDRQREREREERCTPY